MIASGALLAFSASGLGGISAWIAGELTGFYLTVLARLLGALCLCVTYHLVGRWIGARCADRPMSTACASSRWPPRRASIRRYLTRAGSLALVPERSPSRGPPYWKSVVRCRKPLGDDA